MFFAHIYGEDQPFPAGLFKYVFLFFGEACTGLWLVVHAPAPQLNMETLSLLHAPSKGLEQRDRFFSLLIVRRIINIFRVVAHAASGTTKDENIYF